MINICKCFLKQIAKGICISAFLTPYQLWAGGETSRPGAWSPIDFHTQEALNYHQGGDKRLKNSPLARIHLDIRRQLLLLKTPPPSFRPQDNSPLERLQYYKVQANHYNDLGNLSLADDYAKLADAENQTMPLEMNFHLQKALKYRFNEEVSDKNQQQADYHLSQYKGFQMSLAKLKYKKEEKLFVGPPVPERLSKALIPKRESAQVLQKTEEEKEKVFLNDFPVPVRNSEGVYQPAWNHEIYFSNLDKSSPQIGPTCGPTCAGHELEKYYRLTISESERYFGLPNGSRPNVLRNNINEYFEKNHLPFLAWSTPYKTNENLETVVSKKGLPLKVSIYREGIEKEGKMHAVLLHALHFEKDKEGKEVGHVIYYDPWGKYVLMSLEDFKKIWIREYMKIYPSQDGKIRLNEEEITYDLIYMLDQALNKNLPFTLEENQKFQELVGAVITNKLNKYQTHITQRLKSYQTQFGVDLTHH